jgi:hypothetical protein
MTYSTEQFKKIMNVNIISPICGHKLNICASADTKNGLYINIHCGNHYTGFCADTLPFEILEEYLNSGFFGCTKG